MTDVDDRFRPRRRTEPLRLRTPEPTVPPPAHPPFDERSTNPARIALLGGLVVFAGLAGGWPLLVMIAALLAMIFLHELGHYLTAKWAGMKVTEFFIGFGPRIWSFHRGETEYGIKAIPAGAYVKIIGMNNLDEFDPADADRTYMSKPFWRRISVAVAGSTMHFLLAIVCLFVAFSAVGVPGGSFTGDDPEYWIIDSDIPADGPAGTAGLEAGDRILSIDGSTVGTFAAFTDYVRERPGETVGVVVERDGDTFEREITLGNRNPSTDEAVGYFGISPAAEPIRYGALDSVGRTFGSFGDLTGETFAAIGRILSPSGLADLGSRVLDAGDDQGPVVAGEDGGQRSREELEDDLRRPVSIVGITQFGSDILGSNTAGDFFALFALINLFIGIFNLLPLLPLDGGHVAIAVYEKVRSTRLGRPYHVDVVKLLPLTYAVVLVMMFLGVSTIYLDIADPIGG